MAKRKGKRKVRVEFRKNREKKRRNNDLTREVGERGVDESDYRSEERVSGKGDLSRYRTVMADDDGDRLQRQIDESECRSGRVIRAIGLNSVVELDDHSRLECTIRRVLRTLARDERNVVVAGDRVLVRPVNEEQGVIERVEPRRGILSRTSARREHIIVSNVDQVIIVVSADAPPLKPHLIDRFLVSVEKGNVQPIICINKMDLVPDGSLNQVFGLYSGLGYEVVPVSAETGLGIERLRLLMTDRQSVLTGQSGVGKSTLLNAVAPALNLQTGSVSEWSNKGRHTTRRAELMRLEFGGWVADTPGIRQLELWDVSPEEVEAYFLEFRPLVMFCRFPDCTHTHEGHCGVKHAVESGLVSAERYESYLKMITVD